MSTSRRSSCRAPFRNREAALTALLLINLGTPGAPVTIVEFADFQCPFCKQEAAVIRKDLMEAFPGKTQLYFMDYPLAPIHPFARGAAVMGRCIYNQNNGSFWAYHDWIFEHQSEITPDNLRDKSMEFAKGDHNLDLAKLAACAVSFEEGHTDIYQALLAKRSPSQRRALTREYMYCR